MAAAPRLAIKKIPGKNRGVFAATAIPSGTIFEAAEVIVVPAAQRALLDQTGISDYYFAWGEGSDEAAIALGLGSLYNHSFSPNAMYTKNTSTSTIDFIALRKIAKGEEITVNYNGEPEDKTPLWFVPLEE